MAFRYSERNREEYRREGMTILWGLIPPLLLTDLRREAEKAREIARREHGPQAQRLQPVYKHPELDHRPFKDFLTLPELRRTVEGILGPEHAPTENLGILFEPKEAAWCTSWHRDRDERWAGGDLDAYYDALLHRPGMFNQFNGALYDDHSLWVVPGSDARRDTDAELAAFGGKTWPSGPELTPDMNAEAREMACLEYARQMPGAVNIVLAASDVAFYRAVGWHIGNYVPYVRRATLHDGFHGPDDRAWRAAISR